MKLKARSRLTSSISPPAVGQSGSAFGSIPTRSLAIDKSLPASQQVTKIRPNLFTLTTWLTQRQSKLPSLIIGLALYAYLAYLFTHLFPDQLLNWVVPGGFVPIIGLAAVAHVYVGSFLTLSTRRGILLSVGLSWILWLDLHRFVVSWEVVGSSLGSLIGIDIAVLLIQQKNRNKS